MKVILFTILVVQIFSTQKFILASGVAPSTLIGSAGSVVPEYIHNNGAIKSTIGDSGALWIFDNQGTGDNNDNWPSTYKATIQTLFQTDCTASAVLYIAADNIFTAYLNGALVGTFNDWTKLQSYAINLKCGSNNLTVVVQNTESTGPEGVIFAISQDQSTCYNCGQNPLAATYNPNTCQCECISTCFCPSPLHKWLKYPICGCQCPQSDCPPTKFLNSKVCQCQCIKQTCPLGKVQNQNTCSCN